MDKQASDHVWQSARTLKAFGEAIALHLEGELGRIPTRGGYTSPLDAETEPLVPVLAAFNRRGELITIASQPGRRRHRAYVEGLATPACCKRLKSLAEKHGLAFNSTACGPEMTTTQMKNGDRAVVMNILSRSEIKRSFRGLHRDLISVLKACSPFYLVDPVWNRNTVLWSALRSF